MTYLATYPVNGDGSEVWRSFAKDGSLPNQAPPVASSGDALAGAFAVRFTLGPHETRLVPMALSWDLPVVQFGGGRKWNRHYTQFFGTEGTHAFEIARTALEHQEEWSKAIDAWQKPIAEDEQKPLWYRGELFNELYDLADGGTVWGHERDRSRQPRSPLGQRRQLQLPGVLRLSLLRHLGCALLRVVSAAALLAGDREAGDAGVHRHDSRVESAALYLGLEERPRSSTGRIHAQGSRRCAPRPRVRPGEDPFVNTNQYNYQDVSNWRDLNSKYVLMVWRDTC